MRAVFLAKASENELRRRRSYACRDLPGSTPETNHNEFLLLSLPPLAVPARPPPPPIRYQVYPSTSEEKWSINEILRWYSADRLQKELDALRKLQEDAAKKWTDEKWARADSASVSERFRTSSCADGVVAMPNRLHAVDATA